VAYSLDSHPAGLFIDKIHDSVVSYTQPKTTGGTFQLRAAGKFVRALLQKINLLSDSRPERRRE
jgi:hypothetical protein